MKKTPSFDDLGIPISTVNHINLESQVLRIFRGEMNINRLTKMP